MEHRIPELLDGLGILVRRRFLLGLAGGSAVDKEPRHFHIFISQYQVQYSVDLGTWDASLDFGRSVHSAGNSTVATVLRQ